MRLLKQQQQQPQQPQQQEQQQHQNKNNNTSRLQNRLFIRTLTLTRTYIEFTDASLNFTRLAQNVNKLMI